MVLVFLGFSTTMKIGPGAMSLSYPKGEILRAAGIPGLSGMAR
jgi:hypothetical protein